MSRVKIELPEKFIFKSEIPIRISDINYGGHFGNDSLLSIIHEARVRFFKSLGFDELDVEGVGIIMTDAQVQYKQEGFYGDILIIEIALTDFTSIGCNFIYRVTNKNTLKEIAFAKTGIVFFDYDERKTVKIPNGFINRIEKLS